MMGSFRGRMIVRTGGPWLCLRSFRDTPLSQSLDGRKFARSLHSGCNGTAVVDKLMKPVLPRTLLMEGALGVTANHGVNQRHGISAPSWLLPFWVHSHADSGLAPAVAPLEVPVASKPLVLPGAARGEAIAPPPSPSAIGRESPGIPESIQPPIPADPKQGPWLCVRWISRNRRRPRRRFERWWLEYDPPKANYISGKGRGPHGGYSINKADWPKQMLPTNLKKHWEKREKLRYAFRKSGFEHTVPKWGG